jgi:hypothetical protein
MLNVILNIKQIPYTHATTGPGTQEELASPYMFVE